MGSLFRPKYRDRDGTLKEASVWWLKYRANGRVIRESSGTSAEAEAKRLLKRREGAAAEGRHVILGEDKITIAELADDLRRDYQANRRRSGDRLEYSLAHLLGFFGPRRAVNVKTAEITAYVAQRQHEGAANGTVNRELAALKRMFSLGVRAEKLHHMPYIASLKENNVRTGFFERREFEAVRKRLRSYLQPVMTFAYVTGWRVISEILPLQWRQVDFRAGTVRLEPETTTNREGRMFYMTPELRACLERQRAETDFLQKKTGQIIPRVFHRHGQPIKHFRRNWRTACKAAGLQGRIPHDFRRTAVRNLERASVPRSTAMKMVGHKTESIYRRYAIVDDAMLREGAAKLAAFTEAGAC